MKSTPHFGTEACEPKNGRPPSDLPGSATDEGTTWEERYLGSLHQRQKSYASRSTVHLTILMASRMLMLGSERACLGRSGKLLILRLTPRGLRRFRLDTPRSWRISSRTTVCNFFSCSCG